MVNPINRTTVVIDPCYSTWYQVAGTMVPWYQVPFYFEQHVPVCILGVRPASSCLFSFTTASGYTFLCCLNLRRDYKLGKVR